MKLSIIILLLDRELVLNSCSMACHSKSNTQEASNGGNRKVALFEDLEIWEDGELMSQRPSALSRQSWSILKGKAQEMVAATWREIRCPEATPLLT